jgi:cysteine synthase A
MPEGMTDERIKQIREFGAEIIETDSQAFLSGSVAAAKDHVADSRMTDHYFLDQGSNTLNRDSWLQCGEEIVAQLAQLTVVPDYFVCSIGTGGTFSGIAKVLKENFPNIKTIGIEVDRSAPLYRKRHGEEFVHKPHNMMGLGAGVLSVNTDESLIDEITLVEGNMSWERMKQFIDNEGLGIGPTCGGNLLVCEKLVTEVSGKNIVTLFFDSSWKYKSRWAGVYKEYSQEKELA